MPLQSGQNQGICEPTYCLFFFASFPLPLCSIKETSIHTRQDSSLAQQSTIFKVYWLSKYSCCSCHNNSFLGLLTCHAERSTSLDTVTSWTCCLFLLLNPFLNCPQVFPRISLTPALKVWEWRQGQPFPSHMCGFTLQTGSSPSLEPYKQGGALHSASIRPTRPFLREGRL